MYIYIYYILYLYILYKYIYIYNIHARIRTYAGSFRFFRLSVFFLRRTLTECRNGAWRKFEVNEPRSLQPYFHVITLPYWCYLDS